MRLLGSLCVAHHGDLVSGIPHLIPNLESQTNFSGVACPRMNPKGLSRIELFLTPYLIPIGVWPSVRSLCV